MGKTGHHFFDFPLPEQGQSAAELLQSLVEHLLEAANPEFAAACFYNYASDRFREAVGGIIGIKQYLKNPQFQELVNRTKWRIIKLSETQDFAEAILISDEGYEEDPHAFLFTMHKPPQGFYDGCWLIDSVARFRWAGHKPI